MAKASRRTLSLGRGPGEGGKPTFLILLTLALLGCARDENSPDVGAVAPKPNPSVVANAPGGAVPGAAAPAPPQPGADAAALGPTPKKR